jgi:glycolate oxidase FAD binding subunit
MSLADSEAALAEAIKSANGPLSIRGGGTRGIEVEGAALSAAGLRGVTLYEPGALTLVAQAGTPISEIDALLQGENQRLAFEPMDHRSLMATSGEPTLGGVIAGNVSGPRRIQGGAARDYALGVRFVDGAGTVIKNGGRVMKNVTGYDLVKLMCGSHGTLGVLTEVALKVLPRPETQATLVLHGLSDEAALSAMATAMRSPFEVTGAAHGVGLAESGATTLLRIEGFETSVTYRIEALKNLLSSVGADMSVADASASGPIWEKLRDVGAFAGREGDVWRVSCKATDAGELAARSGALEWFFDWAGGLIWLLAKPGADLRAGLGNFDGHATRVRGTQGPVPRFHPEAPGVARLSAGLRARFDPRGILNSGLMGPVAVEV